MVASPTIPSTISFAILPIQNLSKDDTIDMFCTGLVMDLITDLSRYRSFQIISHDVSQDLSLAGASLESLSLDYYVKGAVRYHGDTLYFNLQLVNAPENRLVWAEKFSGPLAELFQIQEEMVEKIVVSLQHFVDRDLLVGMRKKPLTNLNAYECWIRGFQEVKKGSVAADEQARVYFQKAIDIDPYYARAYTGMSLTYFNEWSCQLWNRWEESLRGAFEWAQKALELDEWDHVSMTILGRLHLYNREYDQAEHFLRKALRTNANDAENLIQIACGLAFLGYAPEAYTLYQKARQLKPIADIFQSAGAFIKFELGDFEAAIKLGGHNPKGAGWIDFPAYMAAAHFHLGNLDKMQHNWQDFLEAFQAKINQEKVADSVAALEWMMTVNPFKGTTQLTAFWEHINQGKLADEKEGVMPVLSQNSFTKQGGLWSIKYAGNEIRLADLKGYSDIYRLLAMPYQSIHCTELMGMHVIEKGERVFDEKAKRDYQKRILEIQEALQEAALFQQENKLEALQLEYDQLMDHLAKSTGLGGKTRKVSGSIEKARTAVTWRIRSAIKKINQSHPALGKHLKAAIKTGIFCEYAPENEMDWIL